MPLENPKAVNLSSFCQKNSSLRIKLALLTFYKIQYSVWTGQAILIFEYLQLISQSILKTSWVYENSSQTAFLSEAILYILKLINPSSKPFKNLCDTRDPKHISSLFPTFLKEYFEELFNYRKTSIIWAFKKNFEGKKRPIFRFPSKKSPRPKDLKSYSSFVPVKITKSRVEYL